MQLGITLAAAVVGLLVGSFANVPIHRWPAGGTVTEPRRSACPSCGTTLAARDNVPVLSWLLLRGRCRTCDTPIGVRYLVVEVVTAALFAATAWVHHESPLLLVVLLIFVWSLVVATVIDLQHRIIPDRLTLRLPFVLLPLLIAHAAVTDTWVPDLRRAVITMVALPVGMELLSTLFGLVRGGRGIGFGDVKFSISLGLVVGYFGPLQIVAFLYGSIISAVVIAIGLLVAGKVKLASRIPFGPYLAIGALLVVLFPTGSADVVRAVLGL